MSPGSTRTGRVLEEMVLPALQVAGYPYEKQSCIGRVMGGRPYRADLFVHDRGSGRRIVVSLKWQQVSGTAEQKIPFEVIALLELLESKACDDVYLVLGGPGWTPQLREFYLSGGLCRFIPEAHRVRIVGLEEFIKLVNTRQL
jgi:hypothetical protein